MSTEDGKPDEKPLPETAYDLEALPEPLLSLIKQRLDAAKQGGKGLSGGQPGGDYRFPLPQGPASLLNLLFKVLLKPGLPPAPSPRKSFGFKAGAGETSPQPAGEPLHPSSSGWLVLLMAALGIAGMIFYYSLSR